MKKLTLQGVRNLLLLIVVLPLFFVACTKEAPTAPAPKPVDPPTVVKATLTVTGAPAGIVWYANNTTTYTITSTNATQVKVSINGETPELVGSTLTLNNLTANTTLVFTTVVAAGTTPAPDEPRTISVLDAVTTNLSINPDNMWKNYVTTSSSGTFPGDCAQFKFFPDGTATKYNAICLTGPNTTVTYIVTDNGTKLKLSTDLGISRNILKCTKDSLTTEYGGTTHYYVRQ